jgi:MFS family permease
MVRFVQGIGFAFFSTASFAFIANISQGAHLGQSLSYFFLAPNLSLALVPALGIFLINHFSFNLLFLVCLVLSLSSLFITNKLGRREVVALGGPSIERGSYFCWKVLPPSIISSFIHIIWGALSAFFPLYALNQGIANPGFFFTAIAIMLILGRALGGKVLDLYSRERVILYSLTTPVISMGILTFSKTQPMFILVAMIWGIGHAFLMPSLMVYALDRAGSARGPAIGTFTAISDFGQVLGPMVMGIIIRLTSYRMMFFFLALISFISLNYFYFLVRKKGNLLSTHISTNNR